MWIKTVRGWRRVGGKTGSTQEREQAEADERFLRVVHYFLNTPKPKDERQ